MGLSNYLRTLWLAGLLGVGSIAGFGSPLPANECVGGLCGGTLEVFSNLPGKLLASTSAAFTALDAQNVALYSGVLRSAGFGFGSGASLFDPVETSATLVVRTNAMVHTAGSLTTQNGAVFTTPSLAPAAIGRRR